MRDYTYNYDYDEPECMAIDDKTDKVCDCVEQLFDDCKAHGYRSQQVTDDLNELEGYDTCDFDDEDEIGLTPALKDAVNDLTDDREHVAKDVAYIKEALDNCGDDSYFLDIPDEDY